MSLVASALFAAGSIHEFSQSAGSTKTGIVYQRAAAYLTLLHFGLGGGKLASLPTATTAVLGGALFISGDLREWSGKSYTSKKIGDRKIHELLDGKYYDYRIAMAINVAIGGLALWHGKGSPLNPTIPKGLWLAGTTLPALAYARRECT